MDIGQMPSSYTKSDTDLKKKIYCQFSSKKWLTLDLIRVGCQKNEKKIEARKIPQTFTISNPKVTENEKKEDKSKEVKIVVKPSSNGHPRDIDRRMIWMCKCLRTHLIQ